MTIKTAPEKEAVKEVMLDLPIKRSSLLSHADNIDYALEQIQAYDGDNPVVGYFMRRLLGVSEISSDSASRGCRKYSKRR